MDAFFVDISANNVPTPPTTQTTGPQPAQTTGPNNEFKELLSRDSPDNVETSFLAWFNYKLLGSLGGDAGDVVHQTAKPARTGPVGPLPLALRVGRNSEAFKAHIYSLLLSYFNLAEWYNNQDKVVIGSNVYTVGERVRLGLELKLRLLWRKNKNRIKADHYIQNMIRPRAKNHLCAAGARVRRQNPKDEWNELVDWWSHPNRVSRSLQNAANRAKNTILTHQGKKSFAQGRNEYKVEKGHYEDLIETWRKRHSSIRETFLASPVQDPDNIKSWMKSFDSDNRQNISGNGQNGIRCSVLRQQEQEKELYRKQAEEAQQRAYLASLKADQADQRANVAYQNTESIYGALVISGRRTEERETMSDDIRRERYIQLMKEFGHVPKTLYNQYNDVRDQFLRQNINSKHIISDFTLDLKTSYADFKLLLLGAPLEALDLYAAFKGRSMEQNYVVGLLVLVLREIGNRVYTVGVCTGERLKMIKVMVKNQTMKMHQTLKEEYDIWAMEMKHYLEYMTIKYGKVIQNGNPRRRNFNWKDGVVELLSPVTAAEIPNLISWNWMVPKKRSGNKPSELEEERFSLSTSRSWEAREESDGFTDNEDGLSIGENILKLKETNHALMAISSSNELGDQEAQILAYSQVVKKLEAQLVTFQKQQLSLNEKLAFQANEIHEKDEKLKRYRRIGMKAVKEKEQLQKNYEEEMNSSVFKCSKEDSIGKPSYSRFTKTNVFKGVPPPLSGDYTPKPQEEIDDSLYVYGKKGPQKPEISVSDDNSSEHSTCQSNDSEGSCGNTSEHSFETESESLSEPNEMSKSRLEVTNEKDVSAPKSKEVEPSCVSHIKTPRQPLKDKETHKVNRKNWNDMMERELGEAEVKRVVNTGNGVAKPVWTNANRVNHANKFVPRSVQLNAGRPKFNSVRPNINTGRTNINSVRPKVNAVSPKGNAVRSKMPDHPLKNMVDRGIFDSGYAQGLMTGIRVGNLDFDSVSFVKELGHFNLFSISQICDKQHKVLFTETECLVVSSDFKMPDENQILLKVPRHHNMYSFDMKTPSPAKGFACLIAKATSDESKLWHRRLGHINFKNLNKLVKGNLVRGLPSKVFKYDHTCVACHKGKQHRASCKAKLERLITVPLHTLHMDLFGPTSVKSINHASYCLVITDDCTRFSWVFFLASKDEKTNHWHSSDLLLGRIENSALSH
ncbi:putative ribonuclease H-like domain-containing protein [Tanacetum coccineum]|uniref:Ribonuclease H-like domain-containing protein n=1 Tax=Tanacetum coccineum TaxID=301880 RepID=A0ABQ4ZEC4_9ASTR